MTTIRAELINDQKDIVAVIRTAFGQEDEVQLVDRLRKNNELLLSLVAEKNGVIAGHISFAKGWIETEKERIAIAWLVPLSVAPGYQRQGIGKALVAAGLDWCKQQDFSYVLVVGDPAYYGCFGFTHKWVKGLTSRWSEVLLAAPLSAGTSALKGRVIEPTAFDGLD